MLKTNIAACVLAMLAMSTGANAQTSATTTPPKTAGGAAGSASALAGTWKSAAQEMRLSTPFDVSVWGPNAKSVRTVELRIQPSGEGTLIVTKKVLDGRGRTIAASTSIEEAKLTIGGSHNTVSTRIAHDVTVVSAVRTYPDDPGYKWELTGLRVQIVTFADEDRNTLEVRVDTSDGRDSFWETLQRDARTTPRPAERQKSATPRPSGGRVASFRR
jgi:hypothetical protein